MVNALRNWHKMKEQEEEAAKAAQMTAEQRTNAKKEMARRRAAMRVIVFSHIARLFKAGLPGILAMAALCFVAFRVSLVAAVQVGITGMVSWLANFFISKRRAAGAAGAAPPAAGAEGGEPPAAAQPAVAAA